MRQGHTILLHDIRLLVVHSDASLYHHQLAIRESKVRGEIDAYVEDLVAPRSLEAIVIFLARGVIHGVGQNRKNASLFHRQFVSRREEQ